MEQVIKRCKTCKKKLVNDEFGGWCSTICTIKTIVTSKCKKCGKDIPHSKKYGAKFCSPSCRSRYWIENKRVLDKEGVFNRLIIYKFNTEDKMELLASNDLSNLSKDELEHFYDLVDKIGVK